jgi:hypothetical protein
LQKSHFNLRANHGQKLHTGNAGQHFKQCNMSRKRSLLFTLRMHWCGMSSNRCVAGCVLRIHTSCSVFEAFVELKDHLGYVWTHILAMHALDVHCPSAWVDNSGRSKFASRLGRQKRFSCVTMK